MASVAEVIDRIQELLRTRRGSSDLPPGASESTAGFCLVCGERTRFDSWEPIATACKRNTFICRSCKSIARNRHIARTILELFPTEPRSRSLAEFARRTPVRILHTCASGALHEILKKAVGYRVTEFYDGVPSGAMVDGIECQNLEGTTFPEHAFDLVITEDIFEHVADPEQACRELRRILRPGGYHVSTIAVYWDKPRSEVRATLRNGRVEHFLPKVYHGDPNRPEGALVFVDFGADIVERYLSLTGRTEVLWSNKNEHDEKQYAIYNNMVFVSRVPPA